MSADAANRLLILGFPRSGTTLLSRLLDAHPQISCPPETHLMAAAARFLSEQEAVEGPRIGVLSGLEFLGIGEDEVKSSLRDLVFGFHERIANGAPVWVEKTGVDIFHLEALEDLLAGHARFILLTRNPLDVVASNIELADRMGAWLQDLHGQISDCANPHIGLARAWAERTAAMDAFSERQGSACYQLRYEDLTDAPEQTLAGLLDWIGVGGDSSDLIGRALNGEPRLGLGDFRINEMSEIRPSDPKAWRKRLPRAAASQIVPILAPLMEQHGYTVPKTPRTPSRQDAVRQFSMSVQMRRAAPDPKE